MIASNLSDKVTRGGFTVAFNNEITIVNNFCINDRRSTRSERFTSGLNNGTNYFFSLKVKTNVASSFCANSGARSNGSLLNGRVGWLLGVCASIMVSYPTISDKVSMVSKGWSET